MREIGKGVTNFVIYILVKHQKLKRYQKIYQKTKEYAGAVEHNMH